MLSFREASIKKKLTWMTTLASGTALLLATGAFVAYEWVTFRSSLVQRFSTLAEIIASNVASTLVFNDPDAATETLAVLRARPQILCAGVYTRDGRPFAAYWRDGDDSARSLPPLPSDQSLEARFVGRRLEVFDPVWSQGQVVGTVYIQSDLSELDARLKSYAGIVVVALSLSFLGALAISSRLQRLISQPIVRLAEIARVVSRDKNYSIRAPTGSRDETGLLVEAFNHMLGQIEERETALRQAHGELERRVQERTTELEATNKELEAFTYSVSHDLRAPLRHVDGFSKILLEEYGPQLDANAQRYLSRVRQGTQNMGQLIDDLLSFSRLGRQPVNWQVSGLNSVVEGVVNSLKPETEGRALEWRIGALPFVECDPLLMKQVFANLLSNAVKYTRPRNPAMVEVGAQSENGRPVIYVRDNGVGFSMKYAGKLFGVFQRLHRPEDFEGTGVGLATVQRIVHKHGGRVWAEAELDKGATFYFTLGSAGAEPPAGAQDKFSEVRNEP
ncbi:MAG: ATP-binding protein [Candidatus Acidiferrales bacterium]